jgi:hypothetical protein
VRGVEGPKWPARVVGGVVLDQDRVARDLGERPLQEGLITLRVELAVESLEVQGAPETIEEAKHAIGFADAAGLDRGLAAFERPGVAEAAPLGKARLIAEEGPKGCPRVLFAGVAQEVRPGLFEPEQRLLVIEVIRRKLPFLT